MILLDTTILIDALRGKTEAIRYIDGLPEQPAISVMSVAELYAGVRTKEEKELALFLSIFRTLPADQNVSVQAGYWRRDFGRSHGTSLADAIIAATAMLHGAAFASHNVRHFPMLENVVVPY